MVMPEAVITLLEIVKVEHDNYMSLWLEIAAAGIFCISSSVKKPGELVMIGHFLEGFCLASNLHKCLGFFKRGHSKCNYIE